ncbi:MAG TPA: AAA family ATPase [Gaiellaceae bacterium]|nr:AAA family ATPase [Gaiellaceae bacterium]
MASAAPPIGLRPSESSAQLAQQWRTLTRAATFVAILTTPASYFFLHRGLGWDWRWALVGAIVGAAAFRGTVDVLMRRAIPWPSLFGTDERRLHEEDILARRRAWFWRRWVRWGIFIVAAVTIAWLAIAMFRGFDSTSWADTATSFFSGVGGLLGNPTFWTYLIFLPALLFMNFLILFGPLLVMAVSQIQSFEPGDADWGVKLEDVRGQAEVKEEVRRVVSLWQSGEAFEAAGGKRERGLLFLGAPGTGKTMLSKAIATGFNAPFVSIPGSGFAQTFIGMDAITVRWLAWKAKRLARKWGGQCIVFIDEIDAVGMRRHSLGQPGGGTGMGVPRFEELAFHGPWGALTASGDLVLETRAWRDRLFTEREGSRPFVGPALVQRIGGVVNQAMPGMFGGGGGLALNQLLIVMDGIGSPRFMRRFSTKLFNTLLDAIYIVPTRVKGVRLRLKPAPPAPEQIYFIGACNVPIAQLDPALTRAGRMGRHVWFRTPTKQDRLDIFDLYLGKVTHEPELDHSARRDELARITMGYSPAMIEQVCSIALTYAHHSGRERFAWDDLVEAMATVESGTAQNIEYVASETRAVAIHEAGHAAAAHVYMPGVESTRISIRRRGEALGHHQAFEKEERFSRWRHEEIGALVWTLGAMAAERVFYGENSNGVGGDVQSATARAAYMVGASAMAPIPLDDEIEEEAGERIMKQFEKIGVQIMARTSGGGPMDANPINAVLGDRDKRAYVAQLLGQAYVTAHNLMAANKDKIEKIADEIVARREIYGDDLLSLLDRQQLQAPEIDYEDEKTWPRI